MIPEELRAKCLHSVVTRMMLIIIIMILKVIIIIIILKGFLQVKAVLYYLVCHKMLHSFNMYAFVSYSLPGSSILLSGSGTLQLRQRKR